MSVCPSVPHLRLTWSPHNRSQTGREEATRKPAGHTTGDPSVSHAFFSRSPPTPDKSIGHRITPRGALVASAWRSPSLREAEGTPRAVTAAPPQGLSSGVTGSGPLLVLPVAAAPAVPRASAWRRTGEPTGGAPAFLGRHGEGRCPWSALGDTWLSG